MLAKRKYTITWMRLGDPKILVCTGLTIRIAFVRFYRLLKNNKSGIVVLNINMD